MLIVPVRMRTARSNESMATTKAIRIPATRQSTHPMIFVTFMAVKLLSVCLTLYY
jgi:hypothetical protein